jgi:hypothetical protein
MGSGFSGVGRLGSWVGQVGTSGKIELGGSGVGDGDGVKVGVGVGEGVRVGVGVGEGVDVGVGVGVKVAVGVGVDEGVTLGAAARAAGVAVEPSRSAVNAIPSAPNPRVQRTRNATTAIP